MPRIGMMNGSDVAMPPTSQRGRGRHPTFVKMFMPANIASQIAHNVDNGF
jgi:hypothetical protein